MRYFLQGVSLRMKSRFLSLLHCGEGNANGVTEKRKVYHLNVIVLISVISFFMYGLIYLVVAQENVVFINSALSLFIILPFILIVPVLNKIGRLRLARWVLSLDSVIVVLLLMIYGQANYFNAHFFFLAFCFVLFTYFPLSQWRDISILFLLNLTLFVISHLGFFTPYPEVYQVPDLFKSIFSMFNILISTFILGGMIFLSEHATSNSDGKLEILSTTDSLTGLLNRYGFVTRFDEERTRCQRQNNFSALLFFDLNGFKLLNDKFGHNVGDRLLVEVANRIRGSFRSTDVIGRFGGDEFIALMCPAGKDKEEACSQALARVKSIRVLLSSEYLLPSGNEPSAKANGYTCSASIGMAVFDGDSHIEDVLKQADDAMYEDKKIK